MAIDSITKEQLAKQIGVHTNTMYTWLEHFTLSKYVSRVKGKGRSATTYISITKAFCNAFYAYLKHKRPIYRMNFKRHYYDMIDDIN